MTPSLRRKWRKTEELLGESEREEWKSWLKAQHSKNEDHGIQSHHFMANRWGNNENSETLFSWAPKSLQMVTAAMKLKDACSLEEKLWPSSVQFSSVAQSCPTLWDPMNRSTPGLPVHHQLLEFTQNHVHWVSDAIQPSHPLSSPYPPAFNISQHQDLFQWVSSHIVVKVLEFQLQPHSSFSSKEQASFNFMAVVTIYSDFGVQENKVCHCSIVFPYICHEVMGSDAMILVFWTLRVKPNFSLS